MNERPKGSSTLTVERAADVLLLFSEEPTQHLGVTEIANKLGLSKAAVHRILSSLKNKGFVDLDPISHRYSLGPVLVSLGLTYLNKLDVRKVAAPELAELSRITNETATLSIRTGWTRVYVDQVTPDREVLMLVQIGVPYPLHAGASSKAFLAFLPAEEIDRYLSESLRQVTPLTQTDPEKLRRELTDIRAAGYAVSMEERQSGAGSVAAPVLDFRGAPLAVISVSGPAERIAGEAQECAAALLETTRRVSVKMGHSPREQQV